MRRQVYSVPISLAGGPTAAGSSAFLGRGLLRIRNRRLGGRAVGGRCSSGVVSGQSCDDVDKHWLNILSTPLFLLFYSFVGVLSP